MIESRSRNRNQPLKHSSLPLKVSIPLQATERTEKGAKVFDGRLEAIDEGKAQVCLDQPLSVGTKLEVLVNFKDRKNREMRFRYEGQVTSPVSRRWYQVEVSFEEGMGISGKGMG